MCARRADTAVQEKELAKQPPVLLHPPIVQVYSWLARGGGRYGVEDGGDRQLHGPARSPAREWPSAGVSLLYIPEEIEEGQDYPQVQMCCQCTIRSFVFLFLSA